MLRPITTMLLLSFVYPGHNQSESSIKKTELVYNYPLEYSSGIKEQAQDSCFTVKHESKCRIEIKNSNFLEIKRQNKLRMIAFTSNMNQNGKYLIKN